MVLLGCWVPIGDAPKSHMAHQLPGKPVAQIAQTEYQIECQWATIAQQIFYGHLAKKLPFCKK